jgi:hypothetical protein
VKAAAHDAIAAEKAKRAAREAAQRNVEVDGARGVRHRRALVKRRNVSHGLLESPKLKAQL